MRTFRILQPEDRPDVEVFIDGDWCPGELRMWTQHDDDTWTGDVAYRPLGELFELLRDVREG